MGIQGFPRPAAIVPKAVCHSCGRPVAFMKSGTCVYCGATVASDGVSPAVQAGLSPEILIALEGQSSAGPKPNKWRRRMIALFVVSVLIALMMRVFMSPK